MEPNRFQNNSATPAYNLLDHPEFYMLGPSNQTPYNLAESEARSVLDSYSGRFVYSDNER